MLSSSLSLDVPTLAAYHSLLKSKPVMKTAAMLPIISGSPTSWEHLYNVLKEAEKVKNHIFKGGNTIISLALQLYIYQSHHVSTRAWHPKWFCISHERAPPCALRIKICWKVDWWKWSRSILWRSSMQTMCYYKMPVISRLIITCSNKVCNSMNLPVGKSRSQVRLFHVLSNCCSDFPLPYKGIRITLWQLVKTVFYGLEICFCLLGLDFLVAFSQLNNHCPCIQTDATNICFLILVPVVPFLVPFFCHSPIRL